MLHLPASSTSKELLGSKTLFKRRLDVSHAPEAYIQLRQCQKTPRLVPKHNLPRTLILERELQVQEQQFLE